MYLPTSIDARLSDSQKARNQDYIDGSYNPSHLYTMDQTSKCAIGLYHDKDIMWNQVVRGRALGAAGRLDGSVNGANARPCSERSHEQRVTQPGVVGMNGQRVSIENRNEQVSSESASQTARILR